MKNEKKKRDYRRKLSIRKKVSGTAERPRVCAVKTNKHIQVQVIDDAAGKTLFTVQTFGKNKVGTRVNKENAVAIGKAVADKLKSNNIETAVYDRNGKQYCGVVATIADSIREGGVRI
ncbi:MAG: 50S ribosomal protein L18 [Halobacteriovoraceae bacterium]|nr:50S ribosomal protein L18 [Halobacteriovoraceae bacterium]